MLQRRQKPERRFSNHGNTPRTERTSFRQSEIRMRTHIHTSSTELTSSMNSIRISMKNAQRRIFSLMALLLPSLAELCQSELLVQSFSSLTCMEMNTRSKCSQMLLTTLVVTSKNYHILLREETLLELKVNQVEQRQVNCQLDQPKSPHCLIAYINYHLNTRLRPRVLPRTPDTDKDILT